MFLPGVGKNKKTGGIKPSISYTTHTVFLLRLKGHNNPIKCVMYLVFQGYQCKTIAVKKKYTRYKDIDIKDIKV